MCRAQSGLAHSRIKKGRVISQKPKFGAVLPGGGRVNLVAAGVTVFELARIMGTSVLMIERHCGALLDGAHAGIAGRLDAIEAQLEQAAEEGAR